MKVTKETFPKEWDPMLLSELVEKAEITLDRGEVISSITMASKPGNYPVYSSSAKNNGLMGYWGEYQIDEELITWSVDGGGYLFYRPKHKFSVTNVCGMLRANKDKFNIRYLHYLLEWQHSLMTFDYVDKAHPSVIRKRYLIPTIGKSEQDSIATILSTLDRAIASTEQLIAKYQRIKTGLLHDLLTRGIDEHGNLRSEKMHKFKDSKLGRIPVDWEPSTIGQSCFVRNEYRKPLSQEVRAKMQGDYRYYGPTGIFDYINEYRIEGMYVLIGEDGDHFLKHKSQEQTILVEGKFNVNNHAHILEGSKDCLTEWIHLFFSHRDITLHLTRQGAGRYKLNKTSLLNLDIALPKVDEQREILKRVDTLKVKNEKDKLNLTKLQSLKTGLMQDLLSGKVRVK